MNNNMEKDPEIDKLENLMKKIFFRGPIWLWKLVKYIFKKIVKFKRYVQKVRQKRRERKEGIENRENEKDLKKRENAKKYDLGNKKENNKGLDSVAKENRKNKGRSLDEQSLGGRTSISRDHITRDLGHASTSRGRMPRAEKMQFNKSNKGSKQRLSSLIVGAKQQAELQNNRLRRTNSLDKNMRFQPRPAR